MFFEKFSFSINRNPDYRVRISYPLKKESILTVYICQIKCIFTVIFQPKTDFSKQEIFNIYNPIRKLPEVYINDFC